jgi:hypothetical protein
MTNRIETQLVGTESTSLTFQADFVVHLIGAVDLATAQFTL